MILEAKVANDSLLNKAEVCKFIQKETSVSYGFCEFFKNFFLKNISADWFYWDMVGTKIKGKGSNKTVNLTATLSTSKGYILSSFFSYRR